VNRYALLGIDLSNTKNVYGAYYPPNLSEAPRRAKISARDFQITNQRYQSISLRKPCNSAKILVCFPKY
jgi:hypothetical protein